MRQRAHYLIQVREFASFVVGCLGMANLHCLFDQLADEEALNDLVG
jgi:hypothetical protein